MGLKQCHCDVDQHSSLMLSNGSFRLGLLHEMHTSFNQVACSDKTAHGLLAYTTCVHCKFNSMRKSNSFCLMQCELALRACTEQLTFPRPNKHKLGGWVPTPTGVFGKALGAHLVTVPGAHLATVQEAPLIKMHKQRLQYRWRRFSNAFTRRAYSGV